MSAPDRSSEVATIVGAHKALLDGNEDHRRQVLVFICDELNSDDHGQWGVLSKDDRDPPFIPSDIIVWRQSREHFDVLTDSGPTWIPRGPIQDAWSWQPARVVDGGGDAPRPPQPRPPTYHSYDESQVVAFQRDVVDTYASAGRVVDLSNVVWAARMQYDAATALTYAESRAKHLAALRAELRLS